MIELTSMKVIVRVRARPFQGTFAPGTARIRSGSGSGHGLDLVLLELRGGTGEVAFRAHRRTKGTLGGSVVQHGLYSNQVGSDCAAIKLGQL